MVMVMVQPRKKFWMFNQHLKKLKMVKFNVKEVWFLLMVNAKKFVKLVRLMIVEFVEIDVQSKLMSFWKEDVLGIAHKIGQSRMVSVLLNVVLEEQRLTLLDNSTLT